MCPALKRGRAADQYASYRPISPTSRVGKAMLMHGKEVVVIVPGNYLLLPDEISGF